MNSFLGGIFRTPRKKESHVQDESSKNRNLSELTRSSPVPAPDLIDEEQAVLPSTRKRKHTSHDLLPEKLEAHDTSPKAGASNDATLDDAKVTASQDDFGANANSESLLDPNTATLGEIETRELSDDSSGAAWTIEAIQKHRWVDDTIELQILWDTGETTWEPETSIQEDAPSALFAYWAQEGGRPSHPSDPELFHIFAIRKAKASGQKLLVEWVGYKEPSWEPRETVEEAAPEMLEEFEARQKRVRKRRRKQ